MMKYNDITCGIQVDTPKGPGVVESYDAKVPELRAHFGALGSTAVPNPLMAEVKLDDGSFVRVPIKHLSTREE